MTKEEILKKIELLENSTSTKKLSPKKNFRNVKRSDGLSQTIYEYETCETEMLSKEIFMLNISLNEKQQLIERIDRCVSL